MKQFYFILLSYFLIKKRINVAEIKTIMTEKKQVKIIDERDD